MKKNPKKMKPGHLDGKRGDCLRRFTHNGCVWHQHLKLREYRDKMVGQRLRPLKPEKEDDRADLWKVEQFESVGLELISTMEHWWLDKEIERTELQPGDYDFKPINDSRDAWQWAWAWQYECWREWQPWSDFELWRCKWHKEIKRLRDSAGDRIRGVLTKEEAERHAAISYGERLPLWLLRDFVEFFPQTPWVKIPSDKRENVVWKYAMPDSPLPSDPTERRKQLEKLKPTGNCTISLEGSLLALKAPDSNRKGLPPIPKMLRVVRNGVSSIRQPDPNNAEEMELYAEWRRKRAEAIQRQSECSDTSTPGHYRHEVVKEIAPGQFTGTYIIHIPWYHTNDDLKAGFAAWLQKKESELGPAGCRKKSSETGWDKHYAALKQLGALRLWRDRKAEAAVGSIMPFKRTSSLFDAKNKADLNLARFFGVA